MMVIITFLQLLIPLLVMYGRCHSDKSGNEVVRTLSKIFMERVPESVHSDKGTEFSGHKVQFIQITLDLSLCDPK